MKLFGPQMAKNIFHVIEWIDDSVSRLLMLNIITIIITGCGRNIQIEYHVS